MCESSRSLKQIIRGILTLVGVGTLLCAVAVFVARYIPAVDNSALIAALAAPIAAPIATLELAIDHRWTLAAVGVSPGQPASGSGADIR